MRDDKVKSEETLDTVAREAELTKTINEIKRHLAQIKDNIEELDSKLVGAEKALAAIQPERFKPSALDEYEAFCAKMDIRPYDGGAELGSSLERFQDYESAIKKANKPGGLLQLSREELEQLALYVCPTEDFDKFGNSLNWASDEALMKVITDNAPDMAGLGLLVNVDLNSVVFDSTAAHQSDEIEPTL